MKIQYEGFTWTLDKTYPTGTYVDGSPWVVAPEGATIVDQLPKCEFVNIDGVRVTKNGSVFNLLPKASVGQGFDSRIRDHVFNSSLVQGHTFPYVVPTNTSLLSSLSRELTVSGNDNQLLRVGILTVVSTTPKEGDFRPSYANLTKESTFNINQVVRKLPNYSIPTEAPSIENLLHSNKLPHLELKNNWTSGYLYPTDNQKPYGAKIAYQAAHAITALALNHPTEQKRLLMIYVLQKAIDIYGSIEQGLTFNADGGHRCGRKLYLAFGAKMLEHAGMLATAGNTSLWQEDQQHFYVSQADVDIVRVAPKGNYTSADIGRPEWGVRHASQPKEDDSRWEGPNYRFVNGGPMSATTVAIRLHNLELIWNNQAFIDYHETRFIPKEQLYASNADNKIPPYSLALFKGAVPVQPGDPTLPEIPPVPPIEPEPEPVPEPPVKKVFVEIIVEEITEKVMIDSTGLKSIHRVTTRTTTVE